jgi:hypothetical protein
MQTGSSPLLVVAAVAVVVLATAACGSPGGTTTTGAPAMQGANGVCSSFTASVQSLESLKSGALTSQLLSPQLGRAARQLESAREALVRSLKPLGTADTAQGAASNTNLDLLARTLQTDVKKIYESLNASGGVALTVSELPAIRAELATMANDLEVASAELKSFAPGHQLKRAFQESTACQQLRVVREH